MLTAGDRTPVLVASTKLEKERDQTMKNTEIKKILAKVYDLDSKSDDWLECREKALEECDRDKAVLCEREYERLTAMIHGMTIAFASIGYELTCADGYWKIKNKED